MKKPSEYDSFLSFWKEVKAFFINTEMRVDDFHALCEKSKNRIIIINKNYEIDALSQSACDLFGFEREELEGKPIGALLKDSGKLLNGSFKDVVEHISVEKIMIAKRKDGSFFPLDFTIAELTIGDENCFMAILRDVTDKKEFLELERNKLMQAAEEKVKDDYISILSHELRTPVAAIQGSLGLLLNQHKDDLSKHNDLFEIAYRHAERLGKIVNVLLELDNFAKENPRRPFERKPLIPLIREAVSLSKFIADQKKITFMEKFPEEEVYVCVDSDRLIQVCLNLLSNAIKFSPEEDTIIISLEPFDDKVRVSFEDHGVGVPEEFKENLFKAFSQVIKGDTKQAGLGLGLHLSKKIMHSFEGDIGLITDKGKGAIFYFDLPLEDKNESKS